MTTTQVVLLAIYCTGFLGTMILWGSFVQAALSRSPYLNATLSRGIFYGLAWPLVLAYQTIKYLVWDWWQ